MSPEQVTRFNPAGARPRPGGVQCALVTAADLQAELAVLDRTLTSIEAVLDPAAKRAQIADLQEAGGCPRPVGRPGERPGGHVAALPAAGRGRPDRGLRGRVDDLGVLIELAVEEDDPGTLAEAQQGPEGALAPTSRPWRSARCCPASTTSATRSSPSAPRPAAWTPPTSPRCCCGCTCAGPSATATPPRSTTPPTPRRPASSRPPSR